jgi:hypothetical protein
VGHGGLLLGRWLGLAQMNSGLFDFFKHFQNDLNCFEHKMAFSCPKNFK